MMMIEYVMPLMLSWVTCGNGSKLEGRTLQCRLSDRASDQLREWFTYDDTLEKAMDADWFLCPVGDANVAHNMIFLSRDENKPCLIGSVPLLDSPGESITIASQQVRSLYASRL
ncbi:zeaxanthin epoxidase [Salvia divinorum]|uniref:Zeaxanthin epoxidase n=1 Tax=Salvia divinorum TaxID=28513 RepID=A0ABD1IGG6_SALDI